MAMLEHELDKIHDFQKGKTTELARRIASSEESVYRLVKEEDEYHASLAASHYGATSGHDHVNGSGNGNAHRRERSREPTHHYSNGDVEEQRRHDTHAQDGGSDDDLDSDDEEASDDRSGRSIETFEEQFRWLEEQVAVLVADVHDLALYTKLNLTGFMKILKVCLHIHFVYMTH